MCVCTPEIRTPYCGKLNCKWPTMEEAELLQQRIDIRRFDSSVIIAEARRRRAVDTARHNLEEARKEAAEAQAKVDELRKLIESDELTVARRHCWHCNSTGLTTNSRPCHYCTGDGPA